MVTAPAVVVAPVMVPVMAPMVAAMVAPAMVTVVMMTPAVMAMAVEATVAPAVRVMPLHGLDARVGGERGGGRSRKRGGLGGLGADQPSGENGHGGQRAADALGRYGVRHRELPSSGRVEAASERDARSFAMNEA